MIYYVRGGTPAIILKILFCKSYSLWRCVWYAFPKYVHSNWVCLISASCTVPLRLFHQKHFVPQEWHICNFLATIISMFLHVYHLSLLQIITWAPHYLCNDVTMIVDVHGYNTRSAENMNLYVPKYTKEICKRSFAYKGSMLWNDLPHEVKESSSLDAFKSNYRFYIG